MGDEDYGYFGKGTEGYIHYMQAHDECFSSQNHKNTARVQGVTPALTGMEKFVIFITFTVTMFVIFVMVASSNYLAEMLCFESGCKETVEFVIFLIECGVVFLVLVGLAKEAQRGIDEKYHVE